MIPYKDYLIMEIMRRNINCCKVGLEKLNVAELENKLEKLNCERR